ncbi:hypothetical protein [Wolbachia endosymbiont of Wuchereria bancrofti]|uniref:hypothetical protein n=1 Tax=Wolbachia endosymbiont of Wuchereria bancrofti TaxID=96496 RepID=UPI0034E07005
MFVNTPEFIELLSNNGAIISARESTEGHIPLHLAVLDGKRGIIQALINKERCR